VRYRCYVNGELVNHEKIWATPLTSKAASHPGSIPAAKGLRLTVTVHHWDLDGKKTGTDDHYESVT
jgi:hypothetical protein